MNQLRIEIGMKLLRLAVSLFPVGFVSSIPAGERCEKWVDLRIVQNGA